MAFLIWQVGRAELHWYAQDDAAILDATNGRLVYSSFTSDPQSGQTTASQMHVVDVETGGVVNTCDLHTKASLRLLTWPNPTDAAADAPSA